MGCFIPVNKDYHVSDVGIGTGGKEAMPPFPSADQ